MPRSRTFPIVSAAVALAACFSLAAQTPVDIPPPVVQGKPVVQKPRVAPFPSGVGTPDGANTIRFVPASEMSQADLDLAAGAQSTIAARAGYEEMGFNQGRWSYSQIACSGFPNHLFLRFMRNNGAGDISMFSVAIPRSGEGRIRIIPNLRRSYTLFTPSPVNKITIAVFNHIRADDPTPHPYWLETALCYAALAGANPEAAPLAEQGGSWQFPAGPPSVLVLPNRGGAIVRFADVTARPHPMEWTMTFNAGGKLLKTDRRRASMVVERAENPAPVPVTVRPIVQAAPPPGKPIE
ncbi:MAG TPA: hypothetical protein VMA34_03180 [Terracidiphilus sp.]|nr:hypothetical protein [Terracidiphilus sp.]